MRGAYCCRAVAGVERHCQSRRRWESGREVAVKAEWDGICSQCLVPGSQTEEKNNGKRSKTCCVEYGADRSSDMVDPPQSEHDSNVWPRNRSKSHIQRTYLEASRRTSTPVSRTAVGGKGT